MSPGWRIAMAALALALVGAGEPTPLAAEFRAQVDRRLEPPGYETAYYADLLGAALRKAGIAGLTPQFVALVDRNPEVQAFLLLWLGSDGRVDLVGATAASTGRPGDFEYFETPLGVFRHEPGHPDFRAEGTRNGYGIRGYGEQGARVYDFGWQPGRRTWDGRGVSLMRLQVHSTDPELLEPRIGSVQSKGCIRIPASLNRFLDHYGVLDADYERAEALGLGTTLRADREPAADAGRYLVIVDSQRSQRPAWAVPRELRPPP